MKEMEMCKVFCVKGVMSEVLGLSFCTILACIYTPSISNSSVHFEHRSYSTLNRWQSFLDILKLTF